MRVAKVRASIKNLKVKYVIHTQVSLNAKQLLLFSQNKMDTKYRSQNIAVLTSVYY